MAWLNLALALEEELEVEKHARVIRHCDDVDQLREIAERTFRAWCQQVDITSQLIRQLAELEADAAILTGNEIDEHYLEWARRLYPDQP